MSWHFLERWLDRASQHSTLIGKFWITFLTIARIIVITTIGDRVYADEQTEFKCNTLQPGCKNVCFNKFSPITHLRFWAFQIILVSLPSIYFIVYSTHVHFEETDKKAKMQKVEQQWFFEEKMIEASLVNKDLFPNLVADFDKIGIPDSMFVRNQAAPVATAVTVEISEPDKPDFNSTMLGTLEPPSTKQQNLTRQTSSKSVGQVHKHGKYLAVTTEDIEEEPTPKDKNDEKEHKLPKENFSALGLALRSAAIPLLPTGKSQDYEEGIIKAKTEQIKKTTKQERTIMDKTITKHFKFYFISIILRTVLETFFLYLQYYLFGMEVPFGFKCSEYPCPGPIVDCFTSRPQEKTIFLVFMFYFGIFCIILNVAEMIQLLQVIYRNKKLTKKILELKKQKQIEKQLGDKAKRGMKRKRCKNITHLANNDSRRGSVSNSVFINDLSSYTNLNAKNESSNASDSGKNMLSDVDSNNPEASTMAIRPSMLQKIFTNLGSGNKLNVPKG